MSMPMVKIGFVVMNVLQSIMSVFMHMVDTLVQIVVGMTVVKVVVRMFMHVGFRFMVMEMQMPSCKKNK